MVNYLLLILNHIKNQGDIKRKIKKIKYINNKLKICNLFFNYNDLFNIKLRQKFYEWALEIIGVLLLAQILVIIYLKYFMLWGIIYHFLQ